VPVLDRLVLTHPRDHAMSETWDPADGPDPDDSNPADEWGADEWWDWYDSRPGPRPIVTPPTIETVDPGPFL
jgi:hypothetical protein